MTAQLPPPWPHTPLGEALSETTLAEIESIDPLSENELLQIQTEVQADSARFTFARASACLAEGWSHDDWPSRVGSLQHYVGALASELERTLEREQQWMRIAGYGPVTPAGESLDTNG